MNRNGAIETLKEFVKNTDNAIVKDAILELHPELAESQDESQDERIRKEMLDYFKVKKERLDYLCFECGDMKNAPFKEAKMFEDFLTYIEKQKPVGWGEKDEWMIEELCCLVDSYELEEQQPEKIKLWLKSLRPQPKQEWSEEDKEMLDAMIDIVSNSLYEPLCPREGMLAWLKSLRPQTKQKWSKEDEHRRTDAIDFLDMAKKHYADTSEIEKTISWLRNL